MASDDIAVRRLEVAEFDLLRRLRLAALADAPTMFLQTLEEAAQYSEQDWRGRARRYATGVSGVCFVAHRRSESIGMVFGFIDEKDTCIARVGGMWVAPIARRAGAGTKLLAAVHDWAFERACSKLRLHVFHAGSDAQAFYLRQGFRRVAAEPDEDGFLEYERPLRVA